MSIWAALAGGFAGTLVLTTVLRAASELKLTRVDLPFLLGSAFTANRTRAKVLGYLLHFAAGQVFALGYYALFVAIDRSGWLLGAGSASATASSPAPPPATSWCPRCPPPWPTCPPAPPGARRGEGPASCC